MRARSGSRFGKPADRTCTSKGIRTRYQRHAACGLLVLWCLVPSSRAMTYGQDDHKPGASQQSADSPDGVWTLVGEDTIALPKRTNIAGPYAVVRLNRQALDRLLAEAPREHSDAPRSKRPVMTLPLPNGVFRRFTAEETVTLSPSLSAAFPEIRSFKGEGLDDLTATAAFGWTSAGFHAAIFAAGGSIYIDPYAPGDLTFYVVYREEDLRPRKRK